MPEYHRPARARKKQRVLRSLPAIPVPGMENLPEIAAAVRKSGTLPGADEVPEIAEALRKTGAAGP
jgi:hypothetical protein